MNVEIAQRLANMRRGKGYSQEALAAKLGLSRQAVSKWERAESQPDTGNLIALADLYGVTLDELVRVEADIADDVRFEEAQKTTAAEKNREAEKAADAMNAAAERAEAAAHAAATATEKAEAAAVRAEAALCVGDRAAESSTAAVPDPQSVAEGAAASPDLQAEAAETAAAPTGAPANPQPPFASAPAQPGQANPQPQPCGYNAPHQAPTPASTPGRRLHNPWYTFPYPLLVVVLFLLAGFIFSAWNPAWVLFLTIPFYYWIAFVITNDPNYRASRDGRMDR